MRFALRFLPGNAAAYALFALTSLTACVFRTVSVAGELAIDLPFFK
jgi:hypothetical protein